MRIPHIETTMKDIPEGRIDRFAGSALLFACGLMGWGCVQASGQTAPATSQAANEPAHGENSPSREGSTPFDQAVLPAPELPNNQRPLNSELGPWRDLVTTRDCTEDEVLLPPGEYVAHLTYVDDARAYLGQFGFSGHEFLPAAEALLLTLPSSEDFYDTRGNLMHHFPRALRDPQGAPLSYLQRAPITYRGHQESLELPYPRCVRRTEVRCSEAMTCLAELEGRRFSAEREGHRLDGDAIYHGEREIMDAVCSDPDLPARAIALHKFRYVANCLSRRDGLDPCYPEESLAEDFATGGSNRRRDYIDPEACTGYRLPAVLEWTVIAQYASPFIGVDEYGSPEMTCAGALAEGIITQCYVPNAPVAVDSPQVTHSPPLVHIWGNVAELVEDGIGERTTAPREGLFFPFIPILPGDPYYTDGLPELRHACMGGSFMLPPDSAAPSVVHACTPYTHIDVGARFVRTLVPAPSNSTE
jgi:hypothetical protein